jgi:hypothetical protein
MRISLIALILHQVLYMSHNSIKDMPELSRLNDLPNLRQAVLLGNPIEENLSVDDRWRDTVAKALPRLVKLDGVVIVRGSE